MRHSISIGRGVAWLRTYPAIDAAEYLAQFGTPAARRRGCRHVLTPFPLSPTIYKNLTIRGYVLSAITGDPAELAHGKQFVIDGTEA